MSFIGTCAATYHQIIDVPALQILDGGGRKSKASLVSLVEGDNLSLFGIGFEIKNLVENALPVYFEEYQWPHLTTCGGEEREGRKILPLPHPASFSIVEISLRSLVEQHKTWTVCNTFGKRSTESLRMIGRGRSHQL